MNLNIRLYAVALTLLVCGAATYAGTASASCTSAWQTTWGSWIWCCESGHCAVSDGTNNGSHDLTVCCETEAQCAGNWTAAAIGKDSSGNIDCDPVSFSGFSVTEGCGNAVKHQATAYTF